MGHVKSLDPKSEKQRHVLLPSRGKIGVTSCDRPSRHVGSDCSDCRDDHQRDGSSDRHGRHRRHPATPAITFCRSLWRSTSILPLRSSTDWTFWRTTPGVTASMIKHSTKRRTVFSLGTLLLSHSITPSFDHTTVGHLTLTEDTVLWLLTCGTFQAHAPRAGSAAPCWVDGS